jgi:hypothetical protein
MSEITDTKLPKGWYKLRNGKIVYFDGSTTKELGKNGKHRYIVTATYFDSKITYEGWVQEYYNEVEVVGEIDILKCFYAYNQFIERFGLEIVKK